jgi:hypothetical protein
MYFARISSGIIVVIIDFHALEHQMKPLLEQNCRV